MKLKALEEMVSLLWIGYVVADTVKKMGSDQGGISDFLYDKIASENYKRTIMSINDLRASDRDLDEYLKSSGIRDYEKSHIEMVPIITSAGEVLDGYNRIAQALSDGEENITVLYGMS